MPSAKRISAILAISAAASLLSGCQTPGPLIPDAVTITYDQVGACNGYQQNSGPGGAGPINTVSVGPNQAYVIFRVVEFNNKGSSLDFHFDPAKLFVAAQASAHVDPGLALATDLGVFTATSTTVPKGTLQGNNGLAVAVVSTAASNGSSEASKTSYLLSYSTPAGEPGVFFVKRNNSQTVWTQTDNCRAIAL